MVFESVLNAIRAVSARKAQLLVAIDGPSASGKTTVAAALSAELGATVIHVDDFFLPLAQHQYQKCGGNIDLARLREVLLTLKAGKVAEYRPFLCQTQTFGGLVRAEATAVVILEGTYSLHPSLLSLYDLAFCLTLDENEQKKRILLRNRANASAFFEKWIPLEKRYFAAFTEKERAKITFI